MGDIIKIVKSLENSGLLTDGATETVEHKMKNQKGRFLGAIMAPMAVSLVAPMASLLIKPTTSSFINPISGK